MNQRLGVLFLITLLARSGLAQAPVVNTWLGGTGKWDTPARWSLGVVPNGSTNIVIPGGIVRQNVNVTISAQLINRGTLSGLPGINLTNNGTLENSGLLSNAHFLTNTAGGTLINTQSGDLRADDLTNGGVLSNAGFMSVAGYLTDEGDVTNSGTLSVNRTMEIRFGGTATNDGVLTVRSLIVSGLGTAGSVINLQGAVLNLGGFSVNLSGGVLDNAGTLNSSVGLRNDARLTNSGSLINQGIGELINTARGTLNNQSGGVITNGFELTNGGTLNNLAGATLTNNFILTNSGELITNGMLTSLGVLHNDAGAELINAGGTIDNEGVLTNAGYLANTTSFNGSVLLYGTLLNSGTLTNSAGAILYNLAGNTLNNFGGTIENTGLLDNDGTLESFFGKIINAGTLSNTVNGVLTNSVGSTLNNIVGAMLTNAGTIENGGTLNNANLATLTNLGTLVTSGDFANLGTLQNSGVFTNSGTLLNRPGGTITNDGVMSNTSILTNEAGAMLNNNESLDNSGVLTNDGAILNSRFATILNTGSFTNNGSLTNDAGGGGENAALSNTGTLTNNGTLVNNGVLDNDGILIDNGALTNSAGAILASQGMFQSNAGSKITNAAFGSMSLAKNQIGGDFQNDGTVTMTGGNALLITQTGMLGGTGSVDGNVVNQGKMKPGDSPGEFLINGDYEQTSAGEFLEEIAGVGPGQNGELLVSGDISLDGLLDVILLNGFVPTLGDSWVVIDYAGSRDGEFSAEDLPALPAGLTWDVNYDDPGHEVALDVAAGVSASTPEPSTWALLATVLVGVLWYGRRRLRRASA